MQSVGNNFNIGLGTYLKIPFVRDAVRAAEVASEVGSRTLETTRIENRELFPKMALLYFISWHCALFGRTEIYSYLLRSTTEEEVDKNSIFVSWMVLLHFIIILFLLRYATVLRPLRFACKSSYSLVKKVTETVGAQLKSNESCHGTNKTVAVQESQSSTDTLQMGKKIFRADNSHAKVKMLTQFGFWFWLTVVMTNIPTLSGLTTRQRNSGIRRVTLKTF